jgi:hypothetical protein
MQTPYISTDDRVDIRDTLTPFLIPTKRKISIMYIHLLRVPYMFDVHHHQGEQVRQFNEEPTTNTTLLSTVSILQLIHHEPKNTIKVTIVRILKDLLVYSG